MVSGGDKVVWFYAFLSLFLCADQTQGNEMNADRKLDELQFGQILLCEALLGLVSTSLMEAYIEANTEGSIWQLVIAFQQDTKLNRSIFDEIVADFEIGFGNAQNSGLISFVRDFRTEIEFRSENSLVQPTNPISRVFSFRRMSDEMLKEFEES